MSCQAKRAVAACVRGETFGMRGEDARYIERPAPAADLSALVKGIVEHWRSATLAVLVHNNPKRIGVSS